MFKFVAVLGNRITGSSDSQKSLEKMIARGLIVGKVMTSEEYLAGKE